MKKALYGTTALGALALMAGPAAAQDGKISLGVGGYYENFFTAVVQDNDAGNEYNPLNVRHEGEVHFKGETTLDNGLTVGFQAQLEAITQGDQIDETYLYFEGGWGRLLMGAENSAPYQMQYTGPSAGLGLNSPNVSPFEQISAAGTSTLVNQTSDANKITYFTPRFFGFQLGASYTPNIDARGGDTQTSGLNTSEDEDEYNHFFGGGLNFVESFGGVDLAIAGGFEYGMAEDDDVNPDTPITVVPGSPGSWIAPEIAIVDGQIVRTRWAAGDPAAPDCLVDLQACEQLGEERIDDFVAFSGGINIGFSGFTLGGSVLHSNNGLEGDRDTLVWDVGATYGAGPWQIGVTYLNGETETAGGDDQLHRVELGGNYRLSPGVKVVGALQYSNDDDASANREEDAWGVILGTRLDF